MTGRVFASSVIRKLFEADPPSASMTVKPILAEPDLPPAGFTVTVRFEPLPPKTIPLSGTSAGFEEEAVRVKSAAGVSTSVTTNGKRTPPWVWSEMWLMVGRSFTGVTSTLRTEVAAAPISSVTVRVTVVVPNRFVPGKS